MTPRLAIQGLTKTYQESANFWRLKQASPIHAVTDVNLEVNPGEVVGLVGESGSGKSTLARLIMRLEEPDRGSIKFDGEDLLALKGEALRRKRREFQMIFQDPFGSLNPRMKVGKIIGESRLVHQLDATKAEREAKVADLLKMVGLEPEAANRYPNAFSGGQRQRIGIARAIACEPSFIVADEPVSALDPPVQAQIINLLMDLTAKLELSVLFVAHDLRLIQQIVDRVAVMYAGRIVEEASVDTLYQSPVHPYTKGLLAASPTLDPDAAAPRALPGEPPNPQARPSGCAFHPRCAEAVDRCSMRDPNWIWLGKSHGADCRLADETK